MQFTNEKLRGESGKEFYFIFSQEENKRLSFLFSKKKCDKFNIYFVEIFLAKKCKKYVL